MANYPTALPNLTDPVGNVKQGASTPTHSQLHKQVNDEIEAIAAELGLSPSGAFDTVVLRLEDIESRVADGETAFGWGNHASAGYLTSITAGHGIDILSSNEVIVDETELDCDIIPFSASGFTATTVHDAIVEAKSSGTPGGVSVTRATFTNASLSAGVLTITHNLALSTPYSVIVSIFNNSYQQIIPDQVTGATNSVAIDLTSYGTLTGTWGYAIVAG
jgi:hypothetical protein